MRKLRYGYWRTTLYMFPQQPGVALGNPLWESNSRTQVVYTMGDVVLEEAFSISVREGMVFQHSA